MTKYIVNSDYLRTLSRSGLKKEISEAAAILTLVFAVSIWVILDIAGKPIIFPSFQMPIVNLIVLIVWLALVLLFYIVPIAYIKESKKLLKYDKK